MPTSLNFYDIEKNLQKIRNNPRSYDLIIDKEHFRDLGITMSNTATFTLHIRNIV